MNATTPVINQIVCTVSTKVMGLAARQAHYRNCRNPKCVAKKEFFEKVRQYVEDKLSNLEIKHAGANRSA